MAKADPKASKSDGKKGDGKKDKKAKKGKKGKKGEEGPPLSVARHPKAGPQVRRAKGWGGLTGFVVAAVLSYQANVPPFEVALRALAVGVAGYVVAWACSVTVWRVLLAAELRLLYEQLYPEPVEPSPSTDAPAPPVAAAGPSGAN